MYVRTPSDLGAAIREQRRRLNVSQQKLADDVGVSRQWLVEVEQGKPRAELGLVLKTLAALGLRVALDDGRTVGRSDRPVAPPPDIDAIVARARKERT
jgi:HTH-type transcriptional regulator/antitoxin HipB